jgi:hypothetical protein
MISGSGRPGGLAPAGRYKQVKKIILSSVDFFKSFLLASLRQGYFSSIAFQRFFLLTNSGH